jgi:hypothetical protein
LDVFWQRWLRIWKIAKPDHAYWRFAGVFFFICAQTWLEDFATMNTGAMCKSTGAPICPSVISASQ